MLSATVLLALISAVSSAKIFEEDYRKPAVTADLVKAVNVCGNKKNKLKNFHKKLF